MDEFNQLTESVKADPDTQTALNTETLIHEPVEDEKQSSMDAAPVSTTDLCAQPETQTGLNMETNTLEPVEHQVQSGMDASTQEEEFETLTLLGDAETHIQPEKPTADAQMDDHTDLQKQYEVLLQAVREISGVSADITPDVVAKILQERWQEKEAEIQHLRDELRCKEEEKTVSESQVQNLMKAASSVIDATEDSRPEDVAEKLLNARKTLDNWQSKARAAWKEKFTNMKYKKDQYIKTLLDPIRLITGISDPKKTPLVLADTLRQAWDLVQAQNDELDQELRAANDRVKQLDMSLNAQRQEIKCLASDIGVCFNKNIKHTDVVYELRRSFDDLRNDIQVREQQRLATRDQITAKNEQIKELKTKMEALTSSLEDLQLLADSKKKGKRWSKKLRLKWWKTTPHQQEGTKKDLEQMHEDLIKKDAQISLLEAKLTTMAEQVKNLELSEKREKDRFERQRAARSELQKDIKLLKFDNDRKENLIQGLRDIVENLKKNCLKKNRRAARYRVKNTVDHVTVASVPNIRCEALNADDILPFSGCHKPCDFDKMTILGKGSYGQVYLGRLGETGQPIAIKRPMLCPGVDTGYSDDILKEERVLMKQRAMKESMVQQLFSESLFFPKIIGMVTIGEDLCTVMDFIGNKKTGKSFPLYQALTRFMPNPKLSLINMLQVCEDIIEGIMELHQRGYLHNDIKTNNVLLKKRCKRWHAVIIDLGLVSTIAYSQQKEFSNEKRAQYRTGRGCYFLAPEVVLYGKRYSVASDIFSFGILLRTISRRVEYSVVSELAERCMKQDPLQRPHTMEEVLREMESIRASY